MSESHFLEVLKPIIDAWQHRNERGAAEEAGKLIFWRDGMLRQIEEIGNGSCTKEIVGELRKGLEESAEGVEEAMKRLNYARVKLAGTKYANQIDLILNNMAYGKRSTRRQIEQLLDDAERLRLDAQRLCNGIGTLNSEIGRLHRMVEGG